MNEEPSQEVEPKTDRNAEAAPPDEAAPARSRRGSLYLWTAVVAALVAGVLAFIGRPLAAYMSLKSAVKAKDIEAGIMSLRRSGPIGTELARRYLARQFAKDRVRGSLLIARNQVLFRGLPAATVTGYLGDPNTVTPRYLNYPLGGSGDRLRIMSIRLESGVVDGVFLDELSLPEPQGQRPAAEPDLTPAPAGEGREGAALEEIIQGREEAGEE